MEYRNMIEEETREDELAVAAFFEMLERQPAHVAARMRAYFTQYLADVCTEQPECIECQREAVALILQEDR